MSTKEDTESVERLLNQAFPMPTGGSVSHMDLAHLASNFDTKLTSLESALRLKIKNSELTQRNWILTGCIATMLVFGGGYISIVGKLDSLTTVMPALQITMEQRRQWMQRQEQRDDRQDRSLEQLDQDYKSMPYVEPPQ